MPTFVEGTFTAVVRGGGPKIHLTAGGVGMIIIAGLAVTHRQDAGRWASDAGDLLAWTVGVIGAVVVAAVAVIVWRLTHRAAAAPVMARSRVACGCGQPHQVLQAAPVRAVDSGPAPWPQAQPAAIAAPQPVVNNYFFGDQASAAAIQALRDGRPEY